MKDIRNDNVQDRRSKGFTKNCFIPINRGIGKEVMTHPAPINRDTPLDRGDDMKMEKIFKRYVTMKKEYNTHSLSCRMIILLGISLLFTSLIFAGPNENAGITFDLNATTYGNQNLLQASQMTAGNYIRLDIYAQDVVNLDAYELEVIYDPNRLGYINASATNPITYEDNFLTINGGTAVGWMVDDSTPGVLSIAYTLADSDTLEAPEGEGLIADIVFQAQATGNTYLQFGTVYYLDSYGVRDEITSTVMALFGGLPPMPPTNLSASTDAYQQNALCLTWTDPTENADGTPLTDLAGINVYFADGTYITSVNPGLETYVVTGLTVGETYDFYATAYDSDTPANESIYSNITSATVIAPKPPDNPTLYSDYTTPNSIQLTWTDPTENIDGSPLTNLDHIDVYYADSTFVASVNAGVETYTDAGLTDGQLYGYFITAVTDNLNDSGRYSLFTITLGAAGNLWYGDAVIDLYVNGALVLDGIFFASSQLKNYTFTINEGDSVFVDYIPGGDAYDVVNSYQIYDNIGDKIISSGKEDGITMPSDVSFIATLNAKSWHAGGSPFPATPGNSHIDAIPGNAIELTWDDPTTNDDGTPLVNFAGINLYVDNTHYASVDPGVGTYTFTTLNPGEYYSFYVTAYDNETPVHESQPTDTLACYNTTLLYVQQGSAMDSIQVALNICTDNDTVLVAPGTYYENIQWPDYRLHWHGVISEHDYYWEGTDGIKLVSESGPDVTIIDAGHHGTGIRIMDSNLPEVPGHIDTTTVIEGFTLQNGQGCLTPLGATITGGGISCWNDAAVTIRGNIFTNNVVYDTTNSDYGVIHLHYSPSVVVDNIITNNTGHGISTRYTANTIYITGNTINENSRCGVFTDHFYTTLNNITGNTITNNGSHGIEGGRNGTIIEDNVITNNGGYGVIHTTQGGSLYVTNCIITGNSYGGMGQENPYGKVYYVTGCTISNNGGTGIDSDNSNLAMEITNSIISNNQGDGVLHAGACIIHFCDIYQNAGFGIDNISGGCEPLYETEAENNWWGDASGPGGLGPGTGDEVSVNVLYEPWSTDPYVLTVVSVPDYSCGEPGSTVTIPVHTTDITGEEVTSSEFTLQYDPGIINVVNLSTSGTLISGTDWTCQYSVDNGTISVEMSGTDVLSGSGTLINLVFEVASNAQVGQESSLDFCDFIYNQGYPDATTEDGVFIVGEIYGALEGTVTEASKGPIQDAVVTAYGIYTYCDTTDASGYYLLPDVLYGLYEMTVTSTEYNAFDTTGVIVFGGETTGVNIQMTQPEMSVYPQSIAMELPVDTTYTTQITISNNGNGPLGYQISFDDSVKCIMPGDTDTGNRASTRQDNTPACLDQGDVTWCVQQYDPPHADALLAPSPKFDEEILHYDSEPASCVGLSSGGTFEAAIRLTPDELAPYDGWELMSVQFYHSGSDPCSGNVKIYREGTSSAPGDSIASAPYYAPGDKWTRTDLSEPIELNIAQDLWVSVEIEGDHPMGVDSGPAVHGKGDFAGWGGSWTELYLADIDRNWNVRAIIALKWLSATPKTGTVPAGQSLDISIDFDTKGTEPGIYTTNLVFTSEPDVGTITIPVQLTVVDVGVGDDPDIHSTHLHSNFPNPVAGNTTFSFSLRERSHVELSVYNIRGQLVATLVDEELDPADRYDIEWDCTARDKKLSSGIYFYKLKTDSYDEIKKMLIVK